MLFYWYVFLYLFSYSHTRYFKMIIFIIYFIYNFTGNDTLNPYGCIQLYCCRSTRLRHRNLVPDMPINRSSSPDLPTLQSRLDGLESLLNEYVIDQTYLEKTPPPCANNN